MQTWILPSVHSNFFVLTKTGENEDGKRIDGGHGFQAVSALKNQAR
jgi:hypothetical protein